jgi:hypothetical protein
MDNKRIVYAFSNQVAVYDIAEKRVNFTIHGTASLTKTKTFITIAPIASLYYPILTPSFCFAAMTVVILWVISSKIIVGEKPYR